VRVGGIAVGRLLLTADDTAQMVAHFTPDTVPILSRHGGVLLGYLDTLMADGPDLRFTGWCVPYPDLEAGLRHGVPVSIETAAMTLEQADTPRDPGSEPDTYPHFRGTVRLGRTLIGVALADRPMARGSMIWARP
jgi:hypothetical protein